MVGKIPKASLAGLAELWESDERIRRRFLFDKKLLEWSKPELTGIPSLKHAKLNFLVLKPFFSMWANGCTKPRTPALDVVNKQAVKLNGDMVHPCVCIPCIYIYIYIYIYCLILYVYDFTLAPLKVRRFWDLLNVPICKIQIYCDAWGLRKMMSQYIRRLPTKSRSPAPGLISSTHNTVYACMTC